MRVLQTVFIFILWCGTAVVNIGVALLRTLKPRKSQRLSIMQNRFLNSGGYALLAWLAIGQAWLEYRFIWPWIARWLAPQSFIIYSLSGHVMRWN